MRWSMNKQFCVFKMLPPPPPSCLLFSQKFTADAGALSFLAGQGFDFNKWIYKGVPYMTMKERNKRMKQVQASLGERG